MIYIGIISSVLLVSFIFYFIRKYFTKLRFDYEGIVESIEIFNNSLDLSDRMLDRPVIRVHPNKYWKITFKDGNYIRLSNFNDMIFPGKRLEVYYSKLGQTKILFN